MANTNNNIYPVNARRLTGADLIPIFGSFINDDRTELEDLVYAITTGNTTVSYNSEKHTLDITETPGIDDHFVIANPNDDGDGNNTTSILFKYNNDNPYNDKRGATDDEKNGYAYTGWNVLDSEGFNGEGKIKMINNRAEGDKSVVLFPQLSVKLDTTLYNHEAEDEAEDDKNEDGNINEYKSPKYKKIIGIADYRTNYTAAQSDITTYINNRTLVGNDEIEEIISKLNAKLLINLPTYTNVNDNGEIIGVNSVFIEDLRHTLKNIKIDIDPDTVVTTDETKVGKIKERYTSFIEHIFTTLLDDLFTPINASMLKPSYVFDADILPDTDFRYKNGMYEYRKYYSYVYNNWYYQHLQYWWRPWRWLGSIWWWNWRWHPHYYFFWHSWYWNWINWYYSWLNWYWNYSISMSTSEEYIGETINMCNVFKYNAFMPNEYIPIQPSKYFETNGGDKFKDYVKYLTNTYKSNIYKIKSYIPVVNKMVDLIIAVCDYVVYDNDNTPVSNADINYNVIYDKYQRIDIDENNKALSDSNLSNDFTDNLRADSTGYDIGINDASVPISEFFMVNGADITADARQYFPIKPIYLLISPKTLNNTNKIIKYKVNLYQYGNTDTEAILTFIMYQMPRLITISYTFSCGGYNIRKDTFGILGNVNNSSPYNPANVNIVTNTEFDEGAARDYHCATEINASYNNYRNSNLSDTPYKYGTRRFYNGTSTIESNINQLHDNGSSDTYKACNLWPTYEYGELPILALNDQDHIVIFVSTISLDHGNDDFYPCNAATYIKFNLHTEDYSSNISVTLYGNNSLFKSNNIYSASNNNTKLHWGSNITGKDFRAYPDIDYGTYRNSNANIMFSHLYGYRIYLKHWYTLQQTSTHEVVVNGKRLKISFVWVNLPVVNSFWTSGNPWNT